MSADRKRALAAAVAHALDSRDAERQEALRQLGETYQYLAGGGAGSTSLEVRNPALPGGGSENLRWLGTKDRDALVRAEAYRQHVQAERDYNPFTREVH